MTADGSLTAIVTRLRAAGCVFAEDEAALLAAQARTPAELETLVERRASGLPLEHVLGWAEFRGLRVAVDEGVFVPRRRTEFLAGQAVAIARRCLGAPPPVVVELCCGSGAVSAALAAALGPVELYAVDVEDAAVRCARRNLADAGADVYQGDLYEPLPATLRGRVDVLAANAPYVPAAEIATMPAEARLYEPRVTLDGGGDGLEVVRRVIAGAPDWLAPGGCLLVETSERQAPAAAGSVAGAGLIPRVARSAELSATVVLGFRPSLLGEKN